MSLLLVDRLIAIVCTNFPKAYFICGLFFVVNNTKIFSGGLMNCFCYNNQNFFSFNNENLLFWSPSFLITMKTSFKTDYNGNSCFLLEETVKE